tara:strand:- start:3241 stop:4353 length:1113 start_codon:yes stop_codon:yes gene_type:complete
MDTYGLDSAIQEQNQNRQYVAEQNALINANNLKRKSDKDAKIQQDSIMGDFNYAKDSVNDLYAGSGIQQAISSRNSRLKGEALKSKQQKAQTLAGKSVEEYGDDQVKTSYAKSQPKVVLNPEAQKQMEAQRQQMRALNPNPVQVEGTPDSRQSFSVAPPKAQPVQIEAPNEPEPQPEALPSETTPTQIEAPAKTTITQEPEPVKLTTPPEDPPEGKGFLTGAIKTATGMSEESSELAGRVGGALTGATLGGLSLYDDIANKTKTGSFFNKKDSGADDFSNVTNMIAGASDLVGLVPGLEWVAGVGNAVGGVGGIVKMFGDHDKNVKQAQSDSTSFKPTANISQSVSDTSGTLDEVATSNVREQSSNSSVY